jgi:PAS domain S-box-containing protein
MNVTEAGPVTAYACRTGRVCACVGAAVLFVLSCTVPAESAVRQVLLLQSFDRGNLILDRFTTSFRVFMYERSPEPVTLVEFVVAPNGFDIPERAIIDFVRSTFASRPPDLVITLGGPAAAFALNYRTQLFPESPLLYSAVDERFLRRANLSGNEAAVAVANDHMGAIDALLQLIPSTANVFMIVGSGELGRFWRQEFERDAVPFRGRVNFIWSDGMSYAEMVRRASMLPPRSAIFFSSFDVDAQGATYPSERILADLRRVANAPVFGTQGAELGSGIVGGPLMLTDDLSRNTADAVVRILAGTSPGALNVPVQRPSSPIFDWRELRRWGISEDRLPAGSVVQFREPTVWERFESVIIGGALALAAQTLLIGALLVSRTKRRRAEQSLRESEGRFRLLANSAPVMIRMSGADGRSSDFNIPWLDFTGRSPEMEEGNGWLRGVHPDDMAACVQTYRLALDRRESYRIEYRLRRFDGEYRWILESGEPRITPDRSFAGFILSAIDITELKTARETLSNLNRRLVQAQDQERSRVARELHDDVCQRMTTLAMNLERLGEEVPEGEADTRDRLRSLYQEVTRLGREINGISHRLHSAKLDFLGLGAAAGTFCKEISAHHGLQIEFGQENVPARLPREVAINLFRVLQEALSNAVKHSGASRYAVSLRATDAELQLEVVDDGKGFDTATAFATAGLGLVSMQERLSQLNGLVVVDSTPGKGTTVRAVVPLASTPTAAAPAADATALRA